MEKQKTGFAKNFLLSFLGIFLGAFLGAFFSYQFTICLNMQETKAKREVLFKTLCNELTFIGEKVQPYDVSKVIYRDPIRLSAPAQLLDGKTLEYRAHKALIESLLKFQATVAKYNDLVQITNLVQNIPNLPDTTHTQIYENILRLHKDILTTRDEVLKHTSCNGG